MNKIKFRLTNWITREIIGYEYLTIDGWKNNVFDYGEREGVFDQRELGDGCLGEIRRDMFTGYVEIGSNKEIYVGDEISPRNFVEFSHDCFVVNGDRPISYFKNIEFDLSKYDTRPRLRIDGLATPTQATSYTVKTVFKKSMKSDSDFDVTTAIQKIKGVSCVCEHHQILEEEYQDADYHIFTVDGFGDKQMEQLKSILNRFGMSAYVEGDDVIKIE